LAGADTLKKILLAGLYHETNTFATDVTGIDRFKIRRGDEILGCAGDGSPIDGFLEFAAAERWSVVPAISIGATPSGVVADEVFEAFWRACADSLRVARHSGLDAIYLALHGAMVTKSIEDPEGELLERLRSFPGVASLPIFGVFDLHANFSSRMADLANCLAAYRENPHVDARLAASRAAELLARSLREERVPFMERVAVPILWPPTGTGTSDPPMSELEAMAREVERGEPDLWLANVVAGFAFADVADAGVSFSAATTGRRDLAQAALQRLAVRALALKEKGLVRERLVDEVLSEILPVRRGPVLLIEPADNIGGGAPGDGTAILRALLRHRAENAAVVINDGASVAALSGHAIGSTVSLTIGGKGSSLDEGPVAVESKLISRSDGRFTLEDRNSHLAAMQGVNVDMGPCAVVRVDGVTILLTSHKTPPFDLGQWRSQGIEPLSLSIIGVKAAVAHRRAYDAIAAASHWVRTPGPCASDLRMLPYRRVRRPIFPLDDMPERAAGLASDRVNP
jgi:microcystin degradation protein MlrC